MKVSLEIGSVANTPDPLMRDRLFSINAATPPD
jgi:hypothetical protein